MAPGDLQILQILKEESSSKSDMRTSKIIPFIILVGFFHLAKESARAQTTLITQEGVVLSRSLSGHANVGLEKAPAKGVTVELRSSDWKTVLASTKTDDNGYFSLNKPPGKVFNVRLSSPGLNPFQLQVRVSSHAAHDLTIHLSVAT